MLTGSKHHFRNKLIFFFVMGISTIIVLGTYRNIYYMNKFASEEFQQKVKLNAQEKKTLFDEYFSNLSYGVSAIANNRLLISSIDKNNFLNSKAVFETMVNANKNYMQLRFLDENGIEKIRCQRDKEGQLSYFVKSNKLQNKSDRYYFKLNTYLKRGQVWFSKLDLNEEYGVIQTPIVPVLRVVTPVYIQGEFKGLIVINVFVKTFLEYLTKSTMFDISLIDKYDNFIIHKDSKYNWSAYSNKEITDKIDLNPKTNNKIFVKNLGIGVNYDYKLIFLQNDKTLQKNKLSSKQLGFFIGFVAILLAIPMGFILSRPFSKLYEQLQDKSLEFESLVQTLEQRVAEEVLANRKKEQILMHQSKLASLGEMIGNIAHQWRQPLTRLSLMTQKIAMAHKMQKIDDTFIAKNEKDMLFQIEFMSNTIDDFRNFFLPSRERELFSPLKSIDEALSLENASLEANKIVVKFDMTESDKQKSSIYGYKNEFAQVILNLINNSKDAFIEKNTLNPTITIDLNINDTLIVISLSDNAGGIDEEIITSIFEPYFTTKFKNEGTGIGLYMSKNIIEMHMNGRLSVENLDAGACFHIEIPKEEGNIV